MVRSPGTVMPKPGEVGLVKHENVPALFQEEPHPRHGGRIVLQQGVLHHPVEVEELHRLQ